MDARVMVPVGQSNANAESDAYVRQIVAIHFDEKGALVREEADPAFPADAHDGPVPEEVPE